MIICTHCNGIIIYITILICSHRRGGFYIRPFSADSIIRPFNNNNRVKMVWHYTILHYTGPFLYDNINNTNLK